MCSPASQGLSVATLVATLFCEGPVHGNEDVRTAPVHGRTLLQRKFLWEKPDLREDNVIVAFHTISRNRIELQCHKGVTAEKWKWSRCLSVGAR